VSGLELRGPRVVLREFTEDDAPAALAYHSDPEVMRFLPVAITRNQTSDAILDLLRETNRESHEVPRLKYDLAVTIDHRVVGAARLHLSSGDPGDGEIGYILRRDVWGSGIATEVARLLVAHGFSELGLGRIWATVNEANAASASVLSKVGMRFDRPMEAGRQLAEGRKASHVYLIERKRWEGASVRS
jgi:[ribosomal protein S5]-alanine N-acetyltransferase